MLALPLALNLMISPSPMAQTAAQLCQSSGALCGRLAGQSTLPSPATPRRGHALMSFQETGLTDRDMQSDWVSGSTIRIATVRITTHRPPTKWIKSSSRKTPPAVEAGSEEKPAQKEQRHTESAALQPPPPTIGEKAAAPPRRVGSTVKLNKKALSPQHLSGSAAQPNEKASSMLQHSGSAARPALRDKAIRQTPPSLGGQSNPTRKRPQTGENTAKPEQLRKKKAIRKSPSVIGPEQLAGPQQEQMSTRAVTASAQAASQKILRAKALFADHPGEKRGAVEEAAPPVPAAPASAVDNAFAEAWKVKMAEMKEIEELRRKRSSLDDAFAVALKEKMAEVEKMRRRAREGDGWAMHALGHWYGSGMKGLEKDQEQAVEWSRKSHEAGCAAGTCELGRYYLNGEGVERNFAHGMMLLAEAAMLGSQCACFNLGSYYANGWDGVPKVPEQARRWFSKVECASIKDLHLVSVKEAAWFATWLEQHPE